MSFDLYAATQAKLTEEQLREFFADSPGIVLEGTFRGDGNILVETATGEPLFVIDPPSRAESEELASLCGAVKPRPRWLTFVSVPAAGEERGIDLAWSLVQRLAELNDGFVYDPQADELLWPDGRRETPKRPVRRKVSIVRVQWFFPMRRLSADAARTFLQTADEIMRQVTPKKRESFLDWAGGEWQRQLGFFHWSGRKPCYSGSAHVEDRPEYPSPPGVAAWELSLSLDEEALRTAKTRAASLDLFVSIASSLRAFYAAAYVERGFVLEGRSLLAEDPPEGEGQVIIPTWKGLPRAAMWLSWFGPPYRDLVKDSLDGLAVRHDDSLLLRIGELPVEPGELQAEFPHLPDALTQDSRWVSETKRYPSGYTGRSRSAKHDRAEFIPTLY